MSGSVEFHVEYDCSRPTYKRPPELAPTYVGFSVINSQNERRARCDNGRWYLNGVTTEERVAAYLDCSDDFLSGIVAATAGMRLSLDCFLSAQERTQGQLIEDAYQAAAAIRATATREVAARKTYFIEAVGLNRVKIGTSTEIDRRLRKLQCASPVELRLVAATNCEEAVLHRLFAADRLHGEWFTKSPAIEAIIQACDPSESQLSHSFP